MPFPDTGGHWAEKQIDDMVEDGWFHGYPDGTFRPDQPATRAELATVLWNKLHDHTEPPPPPPPPVGDFDAIIDIGANPQAIADAAGEGAVIGIAPGTHLGFTVQPRHGQTFVRVDPGVTVLAGEGRTNAFYSPDATAKHVTIRELEITGYSAGYQHGAIEAHRAGTPSAQFEDGGWHVEGCNIHRNAGAGIYLSGNGVQVMGNILAYNGILGVLAKHGFGIVVEGNEIAYNNTTGANWGGEAGGTKFWNTRGMVVRGNTSHHNDGPGLWSDWNNAGTTYEDNTVYENVGAPGIFHEIGGGCTVRNNYIYNNGWPDPDPNGMVSKIRGAIHGAQPGTMTVYGNVIENCAKGITIVSQCRTTSLPYSEYDPWTAHLDAYANTIVDSNLSGRATDCGDMPTVDWATDNQMVGDNELRL